MLLLQQVYAASAAILEESLLRPYEKSGPVRCFCYQNSLRGNH